MLFDKHIYPPSLLVLLHERILDFLASVDRGDYDKKGTAGDDETEFAVADVIVGVCGVEC